jgi:hypothetical protein
VPKPFFEFPYSERYNLHRLPPEVAAAWRKNSKKRGIDAQDSFYSHNQMLNQQIHNTMIAYV